MLPYYLIIEIAKSNVQLFFINKYNFGIYKTYVKPNIKPIFEFQLRPSNYLLEKICYLEPNFILNSKQKNIISKQKNIDLDWAYGLKGACQGAHYDLINLIIHFTMNWDLALLGACNSGDVELVRIFLHFTNYKNKNILLFGPCLLGYLSIVELLISYYGKEELYFGIQYFGFINACSNGHLEIVKLLVENGANAFDIGISTANKKGYLEIVNYLKFKN